MRRLLIALTLLVVGACGAGGGSSSSDDVASLGGTAKASTGKPTETKDREKAWLDFAKCMREQGIEMADPEVSDNGGMVRVRPAARAAAPPDEKKMEAADKACRHHIEGVDGGPGKLDDPEMQDRLVKFAQCMREQGIDVPDPGSDGGRVAFRMVEGDREKFDAARKACEHVAPMRSGGGGTSVEVAP